MSQQSDRPFRLQNNLKKTAVLATTAVLLLVK